MSERPRRNISRFDYRTYNLTGRKVPHQQDQSSSPSTRINSDQPSKPSEPNQSIKQHHSTMEAQSQIELTIEHVNDIIDETPVHSCATKDVDIAVNELVEHRNTLRQHRKHLMDSEIHDEKFVALLTITLNSIKAYFKEAKEWNFKLEQLRIKRANQDDDAKITAMKFTVADLKRKIEEINCKLTVELDTKTDVQLVQMEKDSSNMNTEIKEVSNKYEQLLQTHVTDKTLVTDITKVGKSYTELTKSFSDYLKLLKTEVDERDIYKQRSFDESKLNIKLEKFAGYASETDIYTFQSTFNKIHLQTTPTKLLPDLLKNNFLRGPALSLVKNIPDIDEIWTALKAAYGDTRCLLTKKLQMLSDKGASPNIVSFLNENETKASFMFRFDFVSTSFRLRFEYIQIMMSD
ncbi:protein BCAP-like [Clytia hemisphaerica]|uniref:protein BCAP-like n=1 Tax=Clytia hemisphaerica TaxID=252671 RepID=UPI0034D4054C